MTDEKLYWRIHLNNGEVWFCQKFGYAKDILDSDLWENWMDEEIDYVMIGAVRDCYIDTTDIPPSPFIALPYGVCAIEKLSVPRLSGYHRNLENHQRVFP